MTCQIWPEFELVQDFLPVFVTCKFIEDPIENEGTIVFTFSPLEVYGKNFHLSKASNSKVNIPIWPKIKLVRDFMPDLVTCKFKEDLIKNEGAIVSTTVLHYKSMGKILSLKGN